MSSSSGIGSSGGGGSVVGVGGVINSSSPLQGKLSQLAKSFDESNKLQQQQQSSSSSSSGGSFAANPPTITQLDLLWDIQQMISNTPKSVLESEVDERCIQRDVSTYKLVPQRQTNC